MDRWKQTLLARNFSVADWYSIRDELDPKRFDRRWKHVISAMASRFTKRFVAPADPLIARDKRRRTMPEGPGFAVLALDCLLLETLFGYQRGARPPKTGRAFTQFLRSAPNFKGPFAGGRAEAFADAIRNSLLHDGETRDGWIKWKGRAGGPLIYEPGDGRLVLYRDAFHAAVKASITDYINRLNSPDSVELRRRLKKRIDRLCDDSKPPGA